MNESIQIFRDVIVQIATPYSTGTGFYLRDHGLIVTNFHVIEGNKKVIIEGAKFEKQIAIVQYIDTKYDLAFLEGPTSIFDIPSVQLGMTRTVKQSDSVIAIGHPFGLKLTINKGVVSNPEATMNGIPYLHIDAALNPGNSGGPLIDEHGEIIGINTFVMRDGDNMGFSLPVRFLHDSIESFRKIGSIDTCRCPSCMNVVTSHQVEHERCVNCGTKVQLPSAIKEYAPAGVPRTIENLITKIGHNVELSRSGPNAWEIKQGSATIVITYHDKSGLISADAILCELPNDNIKDLYEYLLRQNYSNEALTLSVREQDIILSVLIYDRYLNEETGLVLLKTLFTKADEYDNKLVDDFGCKWKKE